MVSLDLKAYVNHGINSAREWGKPLKKKKMEAEYSLLLTGWHYTEYWIPHNEMAEYLGATSLRYVARNSVTSVISLSGQSSSLELVVE